jgi:hypothetical protein
VRQEGIDAASRFNDLAVTWSANHQCGLTEVMNAIHSADNMDPNIAELRDIFVAIDRYVVEAYGWSDLDVRYNFRELDSTSGSAQLRYCVSDEVREQLLQRLLLLNKVKHEEETTKRVDTKMHVAGKIRGRGGGTRVTSEFLLDLENIPSTLFNRGQ